MATRRAHNKSRLGCHQCKRRRIKCDGKQPICANCDKKGESCSFLMFAPSSRLSIASTSPGSSQVPLLSPSSVSSHLSTSSTSPILKFAITHTPSPTNLIAFGNEVALASTIPRPTETPFEEPIVDFTAAMVTSPMHQFYTPDLTIPPYLRFDDVWKDVREVLPPSLQDVLYHYEYTTSLSLATNDPAKAAWQACVPELAQSHDFLLNCVLSVASLHLGRLHEGKEDKRRMNAVAAARMNKALTKYRPELENITKENAAALFAGSTLTAVYLFRTSAIDIEDLRASIPPDTIVPPPDIVDKMLSCALRTIWGLRGPLTVLLSGWDWVMNGKMNPVAARKWWPTACVPATPRATEEDERLAQLGAMWMGRDDGVSSSASQRSQLNEALLYLRETFALVSQLTLPEVYPPMTAVPYAVDDKTVGTLTDRGAIFVWSARISREFIQMIEQRDRYALVILAHYAVLPGRVRNVWWLEGLGADIVTAIAMALGRENWALIEWPASVLGVDLENAFGTRKDSLEGMPGELNMEVI
ncbi:uncharacterized protein K460DRAFT_295041 [Cucurbitaria berberidis CBS 394.84]|uniref:Zn(2)-C6 fungal-type domain-containing protein n=1 Tax=Cucurbitaria berberidis CBS 394.84 TaxID=1168544 RepID=A0A9P4G879_9PLEO|nr:uncharacterized protein K460DRAFT_295041 [Cucurbitaria berberidis CBS 394.84]KAF1840873.1 hypothetical protein K460DRAFT_295041 [Cucurbitaria berberidis CBS 394.84]